MEPIKGLSGLDELSCWHNAFATRDYALAKC